MNVNFLLYGKGFFSEGKNKSEFWFIYYYLGVSIDRLDFGCGIIFRLLFVILRFYLDYEVILFFFSLGVFFSIC